MSQNFSTYFADVTKLLVHRARAVLTVDHVYVETSSEKLPDCQVVLSHTEVKLILDCYYY